MIVKNIQNDIETSISRIGGSVKYGAEKIKVIVDSRTDLVPKTESQREKEISEAVDIISKNKFLTIEELIEKDPNKNKIGWWKMRCLSGKGGAVKANNAMDAIKIAKEKNIVDSENGIFCLHYLGENPDCFVY